MISCPTTDLPETYDEALSRISGLEEQLYVQTSLVARRDQELTKACNLLEVLQLELECTAESCARKDLELKKARSTLEGRRQRMELDRTTIPSRPESGGTPADNQLDNIVQELLHRSVSCVSEMSEMAQKCVEYLNRLEKDLLIQKSMSEQVSVDLDLIHKELNLQKLVQTQLSNYLLSQTSFSQTASSGKLAAIAMSVELLTRTGDPASRPISLGRNSGPGPLLPAEAARFDLLARSVESQVARLHATLCEAYARLLR